MIIKSIVNLVNMEITNEKYFEHKKKIKVFVLNICEKQPKRFIPIKYILPLTKICDI